MYPLGVEDLDLGYLEDVVAYSCVRGKYNDIICPSVIEYVAEDTFVHAKNILVMDIVKQFYLDNSRVPDISEIRLYVKQKEDEQLFFEFAKMCKIFDEKLRIEREVLIKSVEEFLKQRLTLSILSESHAKELAGKKIDLSDIYKRLDEAMGIYLMDDIGLNLFDSYEEYVEVLTSEETKISTGHKWLDEQLGGGLLSSGSVMYNFCAPSNIGKSNFIKSIAGNISKQGKNVLVISLEMPRFIYANRFVSDMSEIPIRSLKDHEEEVVTFLSGAKEKGYGDIVIKDFATGSITPQALLSFIKRVQSTLDVDFDAIFIDYPELLKPSRTYSGRHDLTIAQQYIETRAIAFVLGTPIVSVAQLNRESYGKEKPSMQSIGGSIGIMQCSDFAGFLYATDEMKEMNIFGLSVGKSRFGPVNKSKDYRVCMDTLKIEEVSNDYREFANEINLKNETNFINDEDDSISGDLDDLFE